MSALTEALAAMPATPSASEMVGVGKMSATMEVATAMEVTTAMTPAAMTPAAMTAAMTATMTAAASRHCGARQRRRQRRNGHRHDNLGHSPAHRHPPVPADFPPHNAHWNRKFPVSAKPKLPA
jgi:hypothetical protein